VQHAVLKRPVVAAAPTAVTLPKTATDADIKMMAGAIRPRHRPGAVHDHPPSDLHL
jgi:hypothetical protein